MARIERVLAPQLAAAERAERAEAYRRQAEQAAVHQRAQVEAVLAQVGYVTRANGVMILADGREALPGYDGTPSLFTPPTDRLHQNIVAYHEAKVHAAERDVVVTDEWIRGHQPDRAFYPGDLTMRLHRRNLPNTREGVETLFAQLRAESAAAVETAREALRQAEASARAAAEEAEQERLADYHRREAAWQRKLEREQAEAEAVKVEAARQVLQEAGAAS